MNMHAQQTQLKHNLLLIIQRMKERSQKLREPKSQPRELKSQPMRSHQSQQNLRKQPKKWLLSRRKKKHQSWQLSHLSLKPLSQRKKSLNQLQLQPRLQPQLTKKWMRRKLRLSEAH
ncbi:uncharacterized protein LOC130820160 isoform X2 [Amaranthus tricolor]|uniref:uncharacterized protein LOC130820160 isoform X2 n=1 Tax=Amaranthus tricolor TaxID=29722 RepID=UPI00258B17FC|nr:uncharacterized protein LOC130820160 isoform X2 [Amaranthus tricolor]